MKSTVDLTQVSDDAEALRGPCSAVVIARGEMVFTSGQVGKDPSTGQLPEGIEAQTRQALTNMRMVLSGADCDLDDVVRVLVFLADASDRPEFNRVYQEFFTDDLPARTSVVATLGEGVRVEMEAIAVHGG